MTGLAGDNCMQERGTWCIYNKYIIMHYMLHPCTGVIDCSPPVPAERGMNLQSE